MINWSISGTSVNTENEMNRGGNVFLISETVVYKTCVKVYEKSRRHFCLIKKYISKILKLQLGIKAAEIKIV